MDIYIYICIWFVNLALWSSGIVHNWEHMGREIDSNQGGSFENIHVN
jgi:hypothetical protein